MHSAPRIPLIGEDADDPTLQRVFERARGSFGGRVPNLYRTLGHAPDLLEGWISFAWSLRNDAVTPRALRELVILRIAGELDCDYERTHHEPMAIEAGCRPEQVEALADRRDDPSLFDRGERAVLDVATRIAHGESLGSEEWQELAVHFDERGCVELVLTASFYVCVARLLDALAIPLDGATPAPDGTG